MTLLNRYEDARNPLVIYVLKKVEIETDQSFDYLESLEETWKYLWKKYIEKMLERNENIAKQNFPEFYKDHIGTKHWLHFLAKQLDKKERIFEIERIQPSWLSSSQKDKFILIFCLTTGVTVGLILGLTAGLYFIYVTPTSIDMTNALALKLIKIGLIGGLQAGLVEGILSYLGKNKYAEEIGRKIEKQVRQRLENLRFLQEETEKLLSKEPFAITIRRFIRGGVPGILFALFIILSFKLLNPNQLSHYYSAIFLSCIFGGMVFSLKRDEIKIAAIGDISFQKILISSFIFTGFGILYVLCRLLFLSEVYQQTPFWYPIYEVIIFMIVGAIYGAVMIKRDKTSKKQEPQKKHDNGIIRLKKRVISFFTSLLKLLQKYDNEIISLGKHAILSFTSILIVGILIGWFIDEVRNPIVICLGVVVGILAGLCANEGGGVVCLQHFILRVILYLKGSIPWNYAKFLNYATERILLRKVANAYLFINDKLLDYFSKQKL